MKTNRRTRPSVPDDFRTDAARHRAVARRDPRADGHFVYAVSSTSIYCRPSCPSKRPRRENVSFFTTWRAAEDDGFRACRRCLPREPAIVDPHVGRIQRACRLLDEAETRISLASLAGTVGLSRFHFLRLFKRVVGVTPAQYGIARREQRLRNELGKARRVTEAIYAAGYNSSGRFYAASRAMLGMQPRSFAAGGPGERIQYAVGACSLGKVLVASTAMGVCAVLLGDSAQAVRAQLRTAFPRANLSEGDRNFRRLVAKVVGLVEAPARGLSLPLDVRGTAFQRRVWQALLDLPAGTTVTYAQLARSIGASRAARAVASACAANLIAVAVPCHRVVRADGTPSGYRWGLHRKQKLLERESG